MEDFGDILYILAMLAVLVFSALRKKKQISDQQNQPQEQKHSPFDPFDEDNVFDELKEIFKPEIKKPVTAPAVKAEKPKEVLKRIEYKVGANRPKRISENIELVSQNEEYDDFEFNAEDLDLRKAVIYSEILNRPYQ